MNNNRTKVTVEISVNADIDEATDFIKELIQEGILMLADENEIRDVEFEVLEAEPAELPTLSTY